MYHSSCSALIYHESSMASIITPRSSLVFMSGQNDHVHCHILLIYFSKILKYIEFSFVREEVTKVVCQHFVVSILTVQLIPVPPQQRIVFLLKLNLIKEVGHSSVHV